MLNRWDYLKNAADALIPDLRAMPNVPLRLLGVLDRLETRVMIEPMSPLSIHLTIRAVEEVLNDLRECAHDAEDAQYDVLADRIYCNARSLRTGLFSYVN